MDAKHAAGILAGLRIVEVSAFVAVPLGGLTLSQLGAEVIRIDPPGGGIDFRRHPLTKQGHSLYWAGLNQGKLSVTLDPRSETGRDLHRQLITAPGDTAGIFITNLGYPWLAYEDLRKARPDLIMVTLMGNPDGTTAVDYTVNAATGYPMITGPGDPPVNHVLPAWDLIAGNMVATAVLVAERWRARTGEGTHVRISLADVAFAALGHLGQIGEVVINNQDRPPLGNFVFGTFGKDFVTSDNHRIMVVALTPRQWSNLLTATQTGPAMADLEKDLGVDFRDESARFAAREPIARVLQEWFTRHTLSEVTSGFEQHRICWGPYRSTRELVEQDPRVDPAVNPMWSRIQQPQIGTMPMPGTPLDFSAVPRLGAVPAPILGSDTRRVLHEVLGGRTK